MLQLIGNLQISPCIRIAILVFAAFGTAITAAGAENSQPGAPVELKLDYDMVPRLDSPGTETRSLVDGAHPADLPSRVLKVQDRVRALEQTNVEKARLLAERQRLLKGIQGIVRAQERMLEVLETETAASADKPMAKVGPTTRAATVKRGSAVPLRIGPLEIPGWLRPWLVESGLGMVIIVLLGIVFHLRAYAAAKDAELEDLSTGLAVDATAVTAPPAAPREAASPAGAPGPSARPVSVPARESMPPPTEAEQEVLDDAQEKSISSDVAAIESDSETAISEPDRLDTDSVLLSSKTPAAASETEPMVDEETDDMDFLFDILGDDEELAKKFGENS